MSRNMHAQMIELGNRVRQRREDLGLRQEDMAAATEDAPDAPPGLDVNFIGQTERGLRKRFLHPAEVRIFEHSLRWPPGTILGIVGYLDDTPERVTTDTTDVIATLMEADGLTDSDKTLVRNMVQGMARRQDGTRP